VDDQTSTRQKHKCPGCNREFDEDTYFEVPTHDMVQAYTTVDDMKGFQAFRAIFTPKDLVCHVGPYQHIHFHTDDKHHLVKAIKFDHQGLADLHLYHEQHPQPCQTEGCTVTSGIPCYMNWTDEQPEEWHCQEHCKKAGFCWGCGLFSAGTEFFDFNPNDLCASCQEAVDIELDDIYDGSDYDDLDDDDDY
jgi:hypothetical protein